MEKHFFLLLLSVSLLLFVACNDEKVDPDGPFIEFTIDGTQYRINSTPDAIAGSHSAIYATALPLRLLTNVFLSTTNDKVSGVTFGMRVNGPFRIQAYDSVTVASGVQFVATLPDKNTFVLDPLNGIGSIELTAVDSVSGGVFTGTFQFSNLTLQNENQQKISTGHTLTEGRFRITLN